MSVWRVFVGRESEEEGSVSIEMFDSQRHDWSSLEGVSSASRYHIKSSEFRERNWSHRCQEMKLEY